MQIPLCRFYLADYRIFCQIFYSIVAGALTRSYNFSNMHLSPLINKDERFHQEKII